MGVLLFIKAYSRIPFPKNTYEGPLLPKFFSTIEVRLTSAGVASTLLVCRFLFTAVTSSSAKCGECVSCCAWSKRSSSFLISLCSDWKEIFLKLNKWSNSYRCSLAGIWYIPKVKNKNTIDLQETLWTQDVLWPNRRHARFTLVSRDKTLEKKWKDKNVVVGRVFFFPIWVFFHEHSRITGLQGKGESITLAPHYHFTRFADT